MAYQLKYYKDIESQGHHWRVEIHQETDEALVAVEIGPVIQGLKLIVQGDQADIDTAIVKTSLEMVFVDAPDLESERKCGYWEEFYTSSATEYKVKLFKDQVLEWTGYVTPDSFSESLQYRGSVSIIARDNLGALQDFEYSGVPDDAGMQSIITLVRKGLEVVSFPMSLDISGQGARRFPYNTDSSITSEIWEVLFNNKALADKTWLEALESLLYSAGLVLRYVGKNTFILASIRDLPLYGNDYHWDVPILDATFCAYGNRELSPAAKAIVDEIKFEIERNLANVEVPADAYGEKGSYTYYVNEAVPNQFISYEMPVYAINDNAWSTSSIDTSLFFNPFAYGLKEGHSSQKYGDLRATDVVYLAANPFEQDYKRFAIWRTKIGEGKYRFSFKIDSPVSFYDDDSKIGFTDYNMELSLLQYYLRWVSNDGTQSYEYRESSKSWVTGVADDYNSFHPTPEDQKKGFPYSFEFPELEVDRIGYFELEINGIIVFHTANSPVSDGVSRGAYVRINEVTLEDVNLDNSYLPQSLKVTTNYNAKNNIRIQRGADFGFNMGQISSPKTILNGLYVYVKGWYEASDNWKFNSGDTPQPLSVLLHQQLLAYYAKPNNVLTGELATSNPAFNALYEWNGKKHLLMSGALNALTGRMENAVLREFTRYDHMWETWPETDVVEVGQEGGAVVVRIHSNKLLTADDITFPSWMTVSIVGSETDEFTQLMLEVEEHRLPLLREGIVKVDSALILVRQLMAGYIGTDYGSDYGPDYGAKAIEHSADYSEDYS